MLDFGYSMTYPSRTVTDIFRQQWFYSLSFGAFDARFFDDCRCRSGNSRGGQTEFDFRLFRHGRFDSMSGRAELRFCDSFADRIFGLARLASDGRLAHALALDYADAGKFARSRSGFAKAYAGEYARRDEGELRPHGSRQRFEQTADYARPRFQKRADSDFDRRRTARGGFDCRLVFRREYFPHSGHRFLFRLGNRQPRLPDDYGDDFDLDFYYQRGVSAHRFALRAG